MANTKVNDPAAIYGGHQLHKHISHNVRCFKVKCSGS